MKLVQRLTGLPASRMPIEVIMTPVTYYVVRKLKRVEVEDYYDFNTNFNPFKV